MARSIDSVDIQKLIIKAVKNILTANHVEKIKKIVKTDLLSEGFEEEIIRKVLDDIVISFGKGMTKSSALAILNTKYSLHLNNSNTTFANINTSNKWWCDITNNKFKDDLNFVLNNHEDKILYHFVIERNVITEPDKIFRQKHGMSTVMFYVGDKDFTDEYSGIPFIKYLKHKTVY
jgi:hypothetical protein